MQWYQYNRIDNFGQIDPQRGANGSTYWKPDSNILTPPGATVTALLPGVVTSVERTSWGQTVVTIKLSQPINRLATHTFFEHMHDATVTPGQIVDTGTVIGHANYAGEGASLGFGLYSGDVYGNDPGWSTLQADLAPGGAGLLNPVALLDAAKNGTLNLQTSLPSSSGTTSKIPVQLSPNADVTIFLQAIDKVLLLTNPFDISGVQQDSIAGVSFTDPIAWLQQFGQNLVDDFSASVIRFLLILIGLFVLYKVISAFIDFGAVGQSLASGADLVAKGAALAA